MATVTIPVKAWVDAAELLRHYQKLQHEKGDLVAWRYIREIADALEGRA